MTMQQFTANNYLVPASGRVHGTKYTNDFGSVTSEDVINWGTYKINNFPFIPQGAFINNTEGTADLTIIIEEIDYKILVPAGIAKQAQFPAIEKSTFTISGQGKVSIFFVDFPVLPDSGLVNIGNQVSVNLAGFSFSGSLPVLPAVNNQGIPYQTTRVRPSGEFHQSTITGSATSATITPSASFYLQRLKIYIPDDVTVSTSGEIIFDIKVGSATIETVGVYITTNISGRDPHFLDLDLRGIKIGNAGDSIKVTISGAINAGTIFINSQFTGV